jgi:DNA-directed RNA polymerase subunit RPC12/RpoP
LDIAMSAAQFGQSGGRDHERGVVECQKCHSPIFVDKPGNVAVEVSVPCPKCGHRGMYFRRMMHSEHDPNDRRRTPR